MDAEHLGYLIDRYGAVLKLYARQWCSTPEDVVQEAFWKLASQKEMPQSPVPWLYRVVRNAAISALRQEVRRKKIEQKHSQDQREWFEKGQFSGIFVDPQNDSLAGSIASESRMASIAVDADTLTTEMQKIPCEMREIIVAHLWGGLTFEQIGEITGSSAATCYRRYATGLTVLRERLGEKCQINPKK